MASGGAEAASVKEASKTIRPCKLPLMCNVDLDAVAASDKPADPVFVARYQKLIGEYAKEVVRYAWGRREAQLTWCVSKVKLPLVPGEFESWADSSWADVKPS